jgi:hypothetical protein
MFLPIESLLFHGTSIHNVERILRSNRITACSLLPRQILSLLPNPPSRRHSQANPVGEGGSLAYASLRVCSFSRNLSSARSHAARFKHIAGVVLAFDRGAMRTALGRRLFAYNDIQVREGVSRLTLNEAEEAVHGDITRIDPFIRYVIVFKLRNAGVDQLLTSFPHIAQHPNLLVVKDYQNRAFDGAAEKTFDRYMLNIMISRKTANPRLRRSRQFGSRSKAISTLSRLLAIH